MMGRVRFELTTFRCLKCLSVERSSQAELPALLDFFSRESFKFNFLRLSLCDPEISSHPWLRFVAPHCLVAPAFMLTRSTGKIRLS